MTITDITGRVATPVATPPPSTPHPIFKVARTAWRGAEMTSWYAARLVVRFPKASALVASAAVASPWIDAWQAAVAGLAGAVTLVGSAEARVRASSLTALSRDVKRMRKIRRQYAAVMESARLCKTTGRGDAKTVRVPRLLKLGATPGGVELEVDAGPIGKSLADFRGQGDVLASSFRAHHIDYRSPSPGIVRLSLTLERPFKGDIEPATLPAPSGPGRLVIGLDLRGQPVERDTTMPVPVLIAGAQGAGKSGELWATLWALQQAGIPFRVRAFDPKGGVELAALKGNAYHYENNPARWPSFLQSAIRGLEARQADMVERGVESHTPTRDKPLDVMVIDELLTAIALSDSKAPVHIGDERTNPEKAFMVFLSQARAAGYWVIALSQLGQKQVVGPIMDLFGHKTCLRVGSDDLVRAIGYDSKICPAHDLVPGDETAGIGYMLDRFGQPVMYRAAKVEKSQRKEIAARMRVDSERYWAQTEWHERRKTQKGKEAA
jgi:S-DNA-T family DNA segregation ATPase FtsK/SpoIIIE